MVDRRRTETLKIRLSLADKALIEGAADDAGLSVSEFIRRRCMDEDLPETSGPKGVDSAESGE